MIAPRISRKLCAPLFWSGLALLGLSYFTFFPIYYIVSGGIMLIFAPRISRVYRVFLLRRQALF